MRDRPRAGCRQSLRASDSPFTDGAADATASLRLRLLGRGKRPEDRLRSVTVRSHVRDGELASARTPRERADAACTSRGAPRLGHQAAVTDEEE